MKLFFTPHYNAKYDWPYESPRTSVGGGMAEVPARQFLGKQITSRSGKGFTQ